MSPKELQILDDGSALSVVWADGERIRLGAGALRRASRAASAIRARIDGLEPLAFQSVRLTELRPVGSYGVQMVFSDGHDRGVYPWSYLKELAAAE